MRRIPAAVAIAFLTGCSDDDPAPKGAVDAATAADAGGVQEGGGDAGGGESLTPPTIDTILKMTGALHVQWTNPSGEDCDSIEGERKSTSEPYAVVFTVPGSVDNKHDATATEKTTYTYRLRCKVGEAYSPYSNEKSGSPQ